MEGIALGILMYFILPLWLLAGVADWLCHRATDIARTAGPVESVLHPLQFTEIGIAILACLLLEINALVFAVLLACFFLHEATALVDVWYARKRRYIGVLEQHVHSFLELLPLAAGILIALVHWDAFLSLFGLADAPADWHLQAKRQPVPLGYVLGLLAAAALFLGLPFLEELWRGLRVRRPVCGRADLADKVD